MSLAQTRDTGGDTTLNINGDNDLEHISIFHMSNQTSHAVPARDLNVIRALHWISRFGWLRGRELGALMWPNEYDLSADPKAEESRLDTQRKLANKLIDRLRNSRYVISRQLPKNAGNAIVLSLSGARYLQRQLAITIRPGDKWGRSIDGKWNAPTAWEHELLVSLVMVDYILLGAEVKTELELRAENTGRRKYPDGLAKYQTKRDDEPFEAVVWIEIESADKSGAKMLALAHSLTRVQRGQTEPLSGWKPNTPAVVYRSDMCDLFGRPIDHRARVTSAISRHIGANLSLFFKKVKLKNAAFHIEDIVDEPAVIAPISLVDPKINLGKTAFTARKFQTFVNHSIDSRGREWTIKVYASENRYRYEIWDSLEPFQPNQLPRFSMYIEDLEQAFRTAIDKWRKTYYL